MESRTGEKANSRISSFTSAVVIFVRPAPKFTPKFDVRRRDNKPIPQSHESSANVALAKTQRGVGHIKITEEDYELFVGKELSRK